MIEAFITCKSCEASERAGTNHSLVQFIDKHSECGGHYSVAIEGLGSAIEFGLFIAPEFWFRIEEKDRREVTYSTSQEVQKFFLKEVAQNLLHN